MSAELSAPAAVAEHYRSVDSTPVRYALDRPPRSANAFLVDFAALATPLLLAMSIGFDEGLFDHGHDLVLGSADGQQAQVPARIFIVAFFVTFAASVASDLARRVVIAVELVGALVVVAVVVDGLAVALDRIWGFRVAIEAQQVLTALAAMVIWPAVILANAHLPPAVEGPMTGRIRWHAWLRLAVALVVAFTGAVIALLHLGPLVEWMRSSALLGGVGPGVFLVQQLFASAAGIIGTVLILRSRRTPYAPPVGVLVPAHNEAHLIAATIAAVDRAAAAYDGPVHLYVVDNASTDTTTEVAEQAIAGCSALTGEVLQCAEPGKAVALNLGLAHVREPYVARIDADTVVGERCLHLALRHFTHPQVGAVGGLPLPTRERTFLDRARLVEVLVRHGFFQVALMGFDGILGEPGMFVVYRRSALAAVGPIVQGMNGEDTDICLRLNSAGYRSLTDPGAAYRSETPRTWAHLREQRVRWFRSIYHVTAHNRRALLGRHSMAGAVVLPFQLVNAAHRAMLLPLLVFAVLVEGVFRGPFPGLHWEPVTATVLGMPMLVAVGVCLLWRRPRAVLFVPEYLVFRLVRSYLTIAAALSLVFPPARPRARRRFGRSVRGGG